MAAETPSTASSNDSTPTVIATPDDHMAAEIRLTQGSPSRRPQKTSEPAKTSKERRRALARARLELAEARLAMATLEEEELTKDDDYSRLSATRTYAQDGEDEDANDTLQAEALSLGPEVAECGRAASTTLRSRHNASRTYAWVGAKLTDATNDAHPPDDDSRDNRQDGAGYTKSPNDDTGREQRRAAAGRVSNRAPSPPPIDTWRDQYEQQRVAARRASNRAPSPPATDTWREPTHTGFSPQQSDDHGRSLADLAAAILEVARGGRPAGSSDAVRCMAERARACLEAAARGDAPTLAALLRADPLLRDVTDENGCSALQRAAADGHVQALEVLLRHGADPNKPDLLHGNTAAHEAAWKGYSRCCALLAAAGAAVGARNAGGFAPLHLACQSGHNQSCRELLLSGAPPHSQNNYGDTPLHTAARYGHAGVTRILISAQCRVSDQNKNGDTALHIAAAMGRRKLTRILLEAGCDKALKNHQGETARDIATRKNLNEIISILNTPVAKQPKKKEKRDKSKERTIDEPDPAKKPKDKAKKKKSVTFDTPPPVQWSPYGCHYYPDPKYFPKPKLSSLPTEPLQKGEQYYLDLAGNIKKGPIGAGYTCYCAPFFKHMEDKMSEEKKDTKRQIDLVHERLDQKVSDLEIKTQGQISELTRFVAAERAMCKERHQHLEQWLTRGMLYRASERVKKLDFSPKGSLDIPPLKRSKSLEILDAHTEEWNKVNRIIQSFNRNSEEYETDPKDIHQTKQTSKSTEILDRIRSPSPRKQYLLKSSKSSDQLDSGTRNHSSHQSAHRCPNESHSQNVTAEIHVKSNRISVSQSPVPTEYPEYSERLGCTSRRSNTKSPSSSNREFKTSDSECDRPRSNMRSPQNSCGNVPLWKSQVLQKTADDIRKRVLEKEMSEAMSRSNKSLDISQDGYVKFSKQGNYHRTPEEPRKSVQELVAKVEEQQRCASPEPVPLPRKPIPTEDYETPIVPANIQPTASILKMPQQPQRPAPVLKEKPPKSKRFSLHNLIPFQTRKTFQPPAKDNGNNSESSDEEDNPIRISNQPGPMRNTNLLQTLPLPNYEAVSSPSPAPPLPPHQNLSYPHDLRSLIPKDAYFHEIPNRQAPHQPYNMSTAPQYCQQFPAEPGLPQEARNRNPLPTYHHQTGVFDAMMQDHILREMERIPHCYSEHLDQNTEVEISNQNERFRDDFYDNRQAFPNYGGGGRPDHSLLHSRLQSLAINTQLTDAQSQLDRESHNDSGYSTKVYGSSQGPSPSLSGNVEDNLSGQRVHILPNGKPVAARVGASSLV